jgi:hypothetical protein
MKVALQLGESLKFTYDEKKLIKETSDPILLVGAGVQSARSDRSGLQILRQATNLSPSSPVTWAALAYHELKIFPYESDGIVDFETIKNDITKFEEMDPSNSIPLFLKAYLFFKNDEIDKALNILKSVKSKNKTITYEIDIRKSLIEAAEYVGYPSYTSHAYAFSYFQGSTFLMSDLVRDILEVVPEDKELLEIFYQLGKQLEQQAKLDIEIMTALVIQSSCLTGLGFNENDIQITELIQTSTDLRKYSKKLSSLSMRKVSEARWIRFIDESFFLGEREARGNLIKDLEAIEVIN